jgi:hypothetical protein
VIRAPDCPIHALEHAEYRESCGRLIAEVTRNADILLLRIG